MKIPFTNLQITKIPEPAPELSARERLIEACAEATEAWFDCYENRENLIPWIDWQEKEIFAAMRGQAIKIVE